MEMTFEEISELTSALDANNMFRVQHPVQNKLSYALSKFMNRSTDIAKQHVKKYVRPSGKHILEYNKVIQEVNKKFAQKNDKGEPIPAPGMDPNAGIYQMDESKEEDYKKAIEVVKEDHKKAYDETRAANEANHKLDSDTKYDIEFHNVHVDDLPSLNTTQIASIEKWIIEGARIIR